MFPVYKIEFSGNSKGVTFGSLWSKTWGKDFNLTNYTSHNTTVVFLRITESLILSAEEEKLRSQLINEWK